VKFNEALPQLPLADHGLRFNDHALPRVVGLAKRANVPAEEAIRLIHETQKGAGRDTGPEIRSTVERIYADNGVHKRTKKQPPLTPFNEDVARKIANEQSGGLAELERRSPVQNLGPMKPTDFLEHIFWGEQLVTTGRKKTFHKDGVLQEVIPCDTRLLNAANATRINAAEYVVPSAALRRVGRKTDGKPSEHAKTNYGPRQHVVLESDRKELNKDIWAKLLLHLAEFAPLVMVVDTGGKSLHGWFDCEGVPEAQVATFFNYAHQLGADPKMMDIFQLARLPNGTRTGGARQSVIYWDSEAKGRPWNLKDLPGNSFAVRSILDIPEEDSEESNLYGDRFLPRGKAIMLVGPTGVGKSSIALQLACVTALGRDFFGLRPSGPLRTLIVQAENDSYDLRDMLAGILTGLNVTPAEREIIGRSVFYLTLNPTGEWLAQLGAAIEQYQIDVLDLDPLFAYVRGSVADQENMSFFLRAILQPFLEKHNIGLILCHHVNKPATSKKDRPDWSGGDFAYAGSGSGEIANWCKGVLTLRNIGSRDVFELVVGKRHKRAKLTDGEGRVVDRLRIRHSSDPGVIFWLRAEGDEALNDTERQKLSDLAFAFLRSEKNGAAKVKDIAEKMGVQTRTVNRMFEGQGFVVTPAHGELLPMTLRRECGKIVRIEDVGPTDTTPSNGASVPSSTATGTGTSQGHSGT
jgi:hypothetical protein